MPAIAKQGAAPFVPVDRMLPIMRDPDAYTYYREWSGGLVMGGFEPQCKPCFTHGVPKEFEFALLPEDWVQRTTLYSTTFQYSARKQRGAHLRLSFALLLLCTFLRTTLTF